MRDSGMPEHVHWPRFQFGMLGIRRAVAGGLFHFVKLFPPVGREEGLALVGFEPGAERIADCNDAAIASLGLGTLQPDFTIGQIDRLPRQPLRLERAEPAEKTGGHVWRNG